jgi:hypothetical protein
MPRRTRCHRVLRAVYSASFFTVIAFVNLFQFTALFVLCLAGAALPYARRDLWRAATTSGVFFGIPVITIAGIAGMIGCALVPFLYLRYVGLGITDPGFAVRTMIVVAVVALAGFLLAREVRRRQGMNLVGIYQEIPPE